MSRRRGDMRGWARLLNAASPQFIQRLGLLKGTSTTRNNVILLFDFFSQYPGLRRVVGSILLLYIARLVCPGYVRTNIFTNRCKLCGVPSSKHPMVEFKKRRPTIARLDSREFLLYTTKGYFRWSGSLSRHMSGKFETSLEHVKQSWMYVCICVSS